MQSKMKRVLMIAPTPFFSDRGCHMHIAEQAYALQRRGLLVEIVTYHLGRDLPGLSVTRTLTIPWYHKRGPGPSWHKFYVDPLLLITAWRAALRFRPDVIHAHLHEGAVIGWLLSKILSIPLIFDMQGSLTGELIAHRFLLVRPMILRQAWYRLEYWIDHMADAIVAQSTEMQRELSHKFLVQKSRIIMAFDGVNTSVFHPGNRDKLLVQSLNIPADRKVIVYLGGLSPHKGVDILLEAFPKIIVAVPKTFLLLMGYPNEEFYRKQVLTMGLENDVKITGKIPYEDAPRYLTLGDIAVAPKRSQTEANGKIYNYMASGLPTVAFDTVVNRDILGDLGVYVHNLDDVDGLAQAIISLLGDDQTRSRLAEEVRRKAVAYYSWDGVAERLVKAYEQASRQAAR